ncbi:extracellular calcium-sensing receptor-like [Protopterus annectens]|uniref:extracellular calcium-sensing receptor-like n=1 Tax=Protopterus annectens TaxID=7888 RepID=UPI001CFA5A7A|nr:extracellular calcium-sensing receptor-like [Protopterus annectens]
MKISPAARSFTLSDKVQFPSFLRTAPNGIMETIATAKLLIYFGWTWVGIIASDDDYSQQGSQNLKAEIILAGGCVAFLETIPNVNFQKKVSTIIDQMHSLSVNTIVVYASISVWLPLTEEIAKYDTHGKLFFSTTRSCTVSREVFKENIWDIVNGTLGMSCNEKPVPNFLEFLYNIHPSKFSNSLFFIRFWEKAFSCKWPLTYTNISTMPKEVLNSDIFCSTEENIMMLDPAMFDISNMRFAYRIHNAVYAIAHALNDMITCQPGGGPFFNRSCADKLNFYPWQLLHYLKKVYFKNKAGVEIYFDPKGDPPTIFEFESQQIFPNGTIKCITVGNIDFQASDGVKIKINDSAIMWKTGYGQAPKSVCSEPCLSGYRKANRAGEPVCCFDCVPCSKGKIANQTGATECMQCPEDLWPDGKREKCIPKIIDYLSCEDSLGFFLTGLSVFAFFITIFVLCIIIKFRDTPIVKANNRTLSYLLLVALSLCFLCSLIFIGQPNETSCLLRQTAFGIIFSICMSSILAKTIIVIFAFKARNPSSKLQIWVGSRWLPGYIVVSGSLIQIMICTFWLSTATPFPQKNTNSEFGKIIYECNEGSAFMFYCMLGYLGLLAIVCFLLAFLARNLPDRFNEAKYITFSMLVFLSVWLSFIPAYLSTKGRYMVAVEIFAILTSSAGLISCIFIPKCFIILLKPNMNTKEKLSGR